MVHENCGVVGAYSLNDSNVIPIIIDSLRALQHRGQESWGLAIPNKLPLKKLGLVSEAASEFPLIVRNFKSNVAIGHVRYSTFGRSTLQNAQPLKVKDLCVAHNGTIANVEELSTMMGGCSFTPQTMSDTLIAAQRLVSHLSNRSGNFTKAIAVLKNEMVGSFSFTILTDSGCVYAVRDPKGFRPLAIGYHKETNTNVVASESCAFSAIGAHLNRDIEPGEIVKLSKEGVDSEQFAIDKPHSHCAFEYTYFAHPSSIMEGICIYSARRRIGKYLAKEFPLPDADLVIPVPDSARPAALGYSLELGIPFEEALLKDKYSRQGPMRSFIEPFQESRNEINKGILPIREIIDGKNVVVVDDSIVRGNSSKSIVRILRSAGARKISMIITYPPIRYPCYAGIDFPSQEELLAFKHSASEAASSVSNVIGADYVAYNTTTSLARAIGISKKELCFSCSTGDYSSLGITPIFKSRRQVKGED